MDDSPIWTDARTFDGVPWRGAVDCVIAGIPCQGNSLAGRRLLGEDPRNLWPDTLRILREVEPAFFFLENVPGLLIPDRKRRREAPIARILGELAEIGFDAEWLSLSAQALGAPHRRERVFLLAHSAIGNGDAGTERSGRQARANARGRGEGADVADAGSRSEQRRRGAGDVACPSGDAQGEGLQRQRCGDAACDCGDALGDAQGDDQRRDRVRNGQRRFATRGSGGELAHADGRRQRAGRERQCQHDEPIAESTNLGPNLRGELALAESYARQLHARSGRPDEGTPDACGLGIFPPGPGDAKGWARALEADPTLEPAICRVVDVVANRVERLRAIGAGVVPVVAATAFCILAHRLGFDFGEVNE